MKNYNKSKIERLVESVMDFLIGTAMIVAVSIYLFTVSWNAIAPEIFGLPTIEWEQALLMLFIAKSVHWFCTHIGFPKIR